MKLVSTFRILALSAVALLAVACGGRSSGKPSVGQGDSQNAPLATSIGGLPPQTAQGGTGQPVNDIQCSPEHIEYHIHAHLAILLDGVNVLVPAGIGITPPRALQDGFVSGGGCFYWLHTHDVSGIIHVESPTSRIYTLGQFFAIWGEPLSQSQVATFQISDSKPLHVFVGGQPYSGDPAQIPLTTHALITIEIGKQMPEPSFSFPPGL